MSLAETAELSVRIGLDDNLSGPIGKVNKSINTLDSRTSRAGARLKTFGGNMAKVGAIAGGALATGLVFAVKSGLEDLATLENATTSVTGAIQQMGLKGQVTSAQVATWANEIEASVGAAFDDKAIVAATATLIRFGKVTPQNLRPAMAVMTDLAAKTGSVESASSLLAKALADPAKAAGKLARVGVVLTDQQQKQIKAFVKAGDVGKAQKVILDSLAKSTKGAAAASQGPYQRALSTLADVSEDARKALAEGFLPVIERVAKKLASILADPKAIQSIRDFGGALADAFDNAVTFAESVDWKSVGDGLRAAAGFAKRLVDAFAAMPPEAKGLLIAAAGLTKLTGGAPIKFVVDIAKESISSAFGHFFDRGSSPANPLFVSATGLGGGAGGAGGAAGGAAGGVAGLASKAGKVIGGALVVGAVAEIADAIKPVVTGAGVDLHKAIVDAFDIKINLPIPKPSDLEWPFGPKNTPTILPDIFGGNGVLGGTAADKPNSPGLTGGAPGGHAGPAPLAAGPQLHILRQQLAEAKKEHNNKLAAKLSREINALKATAAAAKAKAAADAARQKAATDAVKAKEQQALIAFRAGERAVDTVAAKVSRTTAAVNDARHATDSSKHAITARLGSANARLAAIAHKKTSFKVVQTFNAYTRVSVSEVQRQARYTSRVARTTSLSAS